MDLSFKGVWGYHPLLVSLANTCEPLFIVNRGGNRPSHEEAPHVLDEAIDVCRRAGFDDVLLRGDTDFTMSRHLDRWDDDGVRFVLGYDANPTFVDRAENVHPNDYEELVREAARVFSSTRAKKPPIKEEIVKERGYLNKRLVSEGTAEFDHKPAKAKKTYRIVVLRKYIVEERGQLTLSEDFRYFFYVTNGTLTQAEVIAESNARCNQENLVEQLKNGDGLEKVEGDVADDSEVISRMTGANTTFVFAECDIEHPVRLILDSPMSAGSGQRGPGGLGYPIEMIQFLMRRPWGQRPVAPDFAADRAITEAH